MQFNTIEEALEDLRAGRMIVVVDDEDRENEGDVVLAAQGYPEAINFMVGTPAAWLCPADRQTGEELDLPQMVSRNTDNHCTAFTVSVDAASVTTGISALNGRLR